MLTWLHLRALACHLQVAELKTILKYKLRHSKIAVTSLKNAADFCRELNKLEVYDVADSDDEGGEDLDEVVTEWAGKQYMLSTVHSLVERIKKSDPTWSPALYNNDGSLVVTRRERVATPAPAAARAAAPPAPDGPPPTATVDAVPPTELEVALSQLAKLKDKCSNLSCRLQAVDLSVEARKYKRN